MARLKENYHGIVQVSCGQNNPMLGGSFTCTMRRKSGRLVQVDHLWDVQAGIGVQHAGSGQMRAEKGAWLRLYPPKGKTLSCRISGRFSGIPQNRSVSCTVQKRGRKR